MRGLVGVFARVGLLAGSRRAGEWDGGGRVWWRILALAFDSRRGRGG